MYFDGFKLKHGPGIGILTISPQEVSTKFKFKIEGFCSINEAKYETLISGLEICLNLGAKGV